MVDVVSYTGIKKTEMYSIDKSVTYKSKMKTSVDVLEHNADNKFKYSSIEFHIFLRKIKL